MKSPEQELLADVLDEDVQRAVDSLPPDYRMAVLLADLEGFSYKEIAEILELPVGTVMSRLYRGRKLMEAAMLQLRPRAWLSARRRAGEDASRKKSAREQVRR